MPFIRGLNTVKEQPLLDKPKRVPGAGGGHKLVDYGLDVPRTKESRQAVLDRENEALRKRLADLEASVDQRVAAVESKVEATVQSRVDDALATRFNEMMPCVVQLLANYFKNNQEGPIPVISLGGSNSDNLPPTTRAQGAPILLVTPPIGSAGPREHSPGVGGASSPSVTCTPDLGPSTRAELDSLKVIN